MAEGYGSCTCSQTAPRLLCMTGLSACGERGVCRVFGAPLQQADRSLTAC